MQLVILGTDTVLAEPVHGSVLPHAHATSAIAHLHRNGCRVVLAGDGLPGSSSGLLPAYARCADALRRLSAAGAPVDGMFLARGSAGPEQPEPVLRELAERHEARPAEIHAAFAHPRWFQAATRVGCQAHWLQEPAPATPDNARRTHENLDAFAHWLVDCILAPSPREHVAHE